MKLALVLLLAAGCGQALAQDASSPGLRVLNGSTPLGRASTLKCGANTSCSLSAGVATVSATGGTDISGSHFVTTQAEPNLSAEAVLPTCTGTDKLTFNGTTIICATDQTSAPGAGYAVVQDEGTGLAAESTLNFAGTGVTCVDDGVNLRTTCTIPGGGTDLSAEPFITKVASANLSNEFALGSLATGILKNTTTTGVPTIAVSGTDYAPATSGSVLLLGNGAGGFTNYAGATSCTNQFFTGFSTTGASTCTTDTLASAQHANQGTTTTVLHGNAAGNPSFAAVTLTTDVTGVLGAANGGTGTSQGSGGCVTLGTANGATTTVGPVTWTGTFNTLYINYEITGYNGGTPVGRILVGAASISTTALTTGSSGYEGVAGTLTNMLSIPGAPLAITLSSIGRAGTYHLFGRSGAIKRFWIEGQNGNASVSAASTLYRAVGNFSDLGTNLPIQRAQLTVYDALNSTSASAQTFNTGTTITVIGCP